MTYLTIVVLLIFAIFGFSEFLHILKLKLIFPKVKIDSQLVIKLENDTAERHTRYVCEQFCWYGKSFASSLRFDGTALDDNTFERCKAVAGSYGIKF